MISRDGREKCIPSWPHDDPVVHPDRVELERDPAGFADGFLDHLAERLEVDVARDDVDVRVADGDEGPVPLTVLDLAGGAEEAPMWRALDAALDRVRTHEVTEESGYEKPVLIRDGPRG
jgi:hypothetical protein